MPTEKKPTKTVKAVVSKNVKCICLKKITTKSGSFNVDSEVTLTETEFNHFSKSKAIKKAI
tara:strand:+ start:1889 stop:2071 length:183 start_codon:yes stop_codon:yes gene_type:complete